jgi:hypothetical protein
MPLAAAGASTPAFSSRARPAAAELAPRLGDFATRRIVLTHMNPDMLARLDGLAVESARDGLVLEV